jgi:hypothetical protein
MTSPNEREFYVTSRGEIREDILRFFRNGLRGQADPETGQLCTEDTIRRATGTGTRFFIGADAIDLACQGIQKRDEFLAQQMRIDRAGSAFLRNFHAPQWGEQFLGATGGSGAVTASGVPGTTFLGSTLVPDPFATFGVDEAGLRYQVLIGGVADGDGVATLTLVGIDGGLETNLPVGAIIRWANAPPGAAPSATVIGDPFTGGGPEETDGEFAKRLASRVRHKPGAGNDAMMRGLARAASNAVEDAFVYPCAMNAGSCVVVVTQKRGATVGPNARVAQASTLAAVTGAIVPPGSADIPAQQFVVVLPDVPEPCDVVVQVAQRRGSAGGWADFQPFPQQFGDGSPGIAVATVASALDFTLETGDSGQLPNGALGPLSGVGLMVWDVATSRFAPLNVGTVEDLGGGEYRVLLLSPPAHAIAVGDWLSPATALATTIAEAIEAYFDSLGPGEVVDLATSTLAARAFRRPVPAEEWPSRAGQSLVTYLAEALGSSAADATLEFVSVTAPTVPSDPIDGPRRVTLGRCAVYEIA